MLVHNEYEITELIHLHGSTHWESGWNIAGGKFVRVAPDGSLYRDKDRTIATLLAAIHWDVGRDDFNRYFSYMDEIKQHESELPYEHRGFSAAWSGDFGDDKSQP